jgi:hypothetical protein
VVVLGEDRVVGRALELLLWSTNWNVRFLTEPPSDEAGLLKVIRLLLLAPGLSAERRRAIVTDIRSMPATARVPILQLGYEPDGLEEPQGELDRLVPWPCRAEELRRYIDAALLSRPGAGQDVRINA